MALPNQALISSQVQTVDGILYKLRSYRNPQKVRTDVLELMRNFPSLQARSGIQPANMNGPPTQVLFLAGTIPIYYNNSQYNIPVNIWVPDAYPFVPPTAFVTPTPDMIIKPKHRHVDTQGICYLPYLSSWNATTSNLIGVTSTMCEVFSLDPPVRSQAKPPSQPIPSPMSQLPPYAQPSGQVQYPPQNSYPSPIPGPQGPNDYLPPYRHSGPQMPQGPQGGLPPAYPNPMTSSQPYTEDPAVVAKRNAVRNVTEKTQSRMQEFFGKTTKEIDELMSSTARLEERVRSSAMEKQQLELQKVQATTDVESLSKSFDEITKWLETNDSNAQIDIDNVTEPKDPLSKQLLYLVAEDATIEDTLYYLEKNLMSGELSLEVFMKNVRSLSTEQFLKRATIKRIHERQRSLGK